MAIPLLIPSADQSPGTRAPEKTAQHEGKTRKAEKETRETAPQDSPEKTKEKKNFEKVMEEVQEKEPAEKSPDKPLSPGNNKIREKTGVILPEMKKGRIHNEISFPLKKMQISLKELLKKVESAEGGENKKLIKAIKQFLAGGDVKKLENVKDSLARMIETNQGLDKELKQDIRKIIDDIKELLSGLLDFSPENGEQKIVEKEEIKVDVKASEVQDRKSLRDTGEDARVVVIDLRKKEGSATGDRKSDLKGKNGRKVSTPVETPVKGGEKSPEMDIKYINPAHAGTRGAAAEQLLENNGSRVVLSPGDKQRLGETLKQEMVKQTAITLKNNGAGEIRLILKPEALGKVTLRLKLNNNNIDGRIFVENNTVREMVETSLTSLNQALKEEGFSDIALQVSVGDDKKQQQQHQQQKNLLKKEIAAEFERHTLVYSGEERGLGVINLVV